MSAGRKSKPKVTTFRTQWNPEYKGHNPEMDMGKSCTVPSQTLTVKELMTRHTRGLEIGVAQKEEIYLPEDMEVPRVTDMNDLVYKREQLEDEKRQVEQDIKNERERNKQQTKDAKGTEVRKDSRPELDTSTDSHEQNKTSGKDAGASDKT